MCEFVNAPEQDVAVLSRIRLARNFEDYPFSSVISADEAELVVSRVLAAVQNSGQEKAFHLNRLNSLTEDERGRLLDHFLISSDLLKYSDRAAALLSVRENISIMAGEEDHIRIFGVLPGLQLERSADLAYTADSWIEIS